MSTVIVGATSFTDEEVATNCELPVASGVGEIVGCTSVGVMAGY